jgi:hypothetical protein
MSGDERKAFDSQLLETPDQREAREVAPLLAMMGGVTAWT